MKMPLQRIFALSFIAFLVIGCPERRGNTSAKPNPPGSAPQGKPSSKSPGKPGPGAKNAPPPAVGDNKPAPLPTAVNVAKKDGGTFQTILTKVVEVAPPTIMDPKAKKATGKQAMSKGTNDKEALNAIFSAIGPKQILKANPKPCTPSHIIVLRGAGEKELGVVSVCSIDKKNEDLPARYMDHVAKLEYGLVIPDGKALVDVLKQHLPKSKL